jgi:hypothetical protein
VGATPRGDASGSEGQVTVGFPFFLQIASLGYLLLFFFYISKNRQGLNSFKNIYNDVDSQSSVVMRKGIEKLHIHTRI